MLHTLARLSCLLTALAVLEGHLVLVQGVAWWTMIVDRSEELGVSDAVQDTLSGGAPCELCLAVQDEREKQREQAPAPEAKSQIKFLPVPSKRELVQLFPPIPSLVYPLTDPSAPTAWHQEVPSPPPRLS